MIGFVNVRFVPGIVLGAGVSERTKHLRGLDPNDLLICTRILDLACFVWFVLCFVHTLASSIIAQCCGSKSSKVIYCKVWGKKMKGTARDTLEQDLGELDSEQRVSG